MTVDRLKRIYELPLPRAIKGYLSTYKVPDDFNTDGYHLNYNFSFQNHPHHRTHRVYPAFCVFDNSAVLIAAQNYPYEICEKCNMLGKELYQESSKWVRQPHPGLQTCFLQMTDVNTKATCFILEYPLLSFKDLITMMSDTRTYIPEYILWDSMLQICSVVKYLGEHDMSYDLHEPCNFIITKGGHVKIENLLIYLPAKGRVCTRLSVNSQHLTAIYCSPEQAGSSDRTNMWNLACVFYELAALTPAYPFPGGFQRRSPFANNYWWLPTPTRLPKKYSTELKDLIMQCFRVPQERPTLQDFIHTATKKLEEINVDYKGPRNFLQLLPDITRQNVAS